MIPGPRSAFVAISSSATLVASPATRQSQRLFQSMSENGADSVTAPKSKKRKISDASNKDTTTAADIASWLETADRRELQKRAKDYGIKGNQKSDILRAEIRMAASLVSSVLVGNEDVPKTKAMAPETSAVPITPEAAEEDDSTVPLPKTPATTPKKKTKKSPKPIKTISPPKGWLETYQLVEELRQDRSAPVDMDGSEALPQTELGPQTFRFQVLVALMLSSQTKDATVGETMRALQQHGLTVDNIQQTPSTRLNELIRKVGFHNNKTKYIKQAVEILKEQYDGDIPPTAEELMELPGVGPKMAFIVENVAWNKTTGIGVDTHMHRMFNQLKWVTSKTPEQTRTQLEAWLPKEYWSSVNLLWVGFGQEVQQFKPKMLRKALNSSRPKDALKLIHRLGLDYRKEGDKLGLEKEIAAALKQ